MKNLVSASGDDRYYQRHQRHRGHGRRQLVIVASHKRGDGTVAGLPHCARRDPFAAEAPFSQHIS
jgi:hypothetical protein